VVGCQSWKLALETSANFVATHAGNLRWNLARVSGKCVMGIRPGRMNLTRIAV